MKNPEYLENVRSLRENLERLDKEAINELILQGTSIDLCEFDSLDKAEQIEKLVLYVSDIKTVKRILLYLPESSICLIKEVLSNAVYDPNICSDGINNLTQYFLGVQISNKDKWRKVREGTAYVEVMYLYDEVRPILEEVDWEALDQERRQIQPLIEVIPAIPKFYGLLEMENMIMIYRAQNETLLTDEQITEYVTEYYNEYYPSFYSDYMVSDGLIIDRYICRFEGYLEFLQRNIQGKPMYIPTKENFTKILNDEYFEDMPLFIPLDNFLSRNYAHENDILLLFYEPFLEEVELFMYDILEHFNKGGDLQGALQLIKKQELMPKKPEARRKLSFLLFKFYYTTRFWFHRGHSPREMQKIEGVTHRYLVKNRKYQ